MSVPVSAAPELLDFLSSGDAEEREVSIGLLPATHTSDF